MFRLIPLLLLVSASVEARIKDPLEVLGPYDRPSDLYPNHWKVLKLNQLGKILELRDFCAATPLPADDFEGQAICVKAQANLNAIQARDKIHEIFLQSLKKLPGTVVPSRVANIVVNIAYETSDLSLARQIYQEEIAILPLNAAKTRLDLLWNVGNIYTAPINSKAVQREGMQIYDELETGYRSDPDHIDDANLIAFNKGQTWLDSFQDYEAALREFAKIPPESVAWINAQVYMSWVYLHLGRKEEAWRTIQQVDLDRYEDLQRRPNLLCYKSMVLSGLDKGGDLQACARFNPETGGPELVLTVTRELMARTLPPAFELQVLRQFWTYYEKMIAPSVQKTTDDNFNAMELVRVRAENQLKKLELQNFNLLKFVAVGLILVLLFAFVMLAYLRSKNQRIEKLQSYIKKAVLSRFLPPIIVEEILNGKSRLEAEPKEETVTLMFCDIVGFTALSGQLGVQKTAALLNEFMLTVTDVIYQHQGTIDKFIGDAVMVIFGAPTPLQPERQAKRAVDCALHLLEALERMPQIQIRVGINQGVATVGIFGSEKRSDFTAIGPTVNLASRIEGRARANEILVSPSVAEHLPPGVCEDRGFFELRGIDGKVQLHRVKKNQGRLDGVDRCA